MFADLKKSVFGTLEERISSPFYGSLAFSWIIWNWNAVYATLFVSQDQIKNQTKLAFIISLYSHCDIIFRLYVGPIVSAILLILVVPRLTNFLFKKYLVFEKERIELREAQTNSQRLTIEESVSLRREINELNETSRKQLSTKSSELEAYKQEMQNLINARDQLKIIYAEYGTTTHSVDVTDKVKSILFSDRSLVVQNETFKSDPKPGYHKRLIVVYSLRNIVHTISAQEHFSIAFEENSDIIKRMETKSASFEYDHSIDDRVFKSIDTFFPGIWRLKYNGANEGWEDVAFRNDDEYYYRSNATDEFVLLFKIQHIQFDLENKKIAFFKRAILDGNTASYTKLDIVEIGQKYVGTENDGKLTVEYTRIQGQ